MFSASRTLRQQRMSSPMAQLKIAAGQRGFFSLVVSDGVSCLMTSDENAAMPVSPDGAHASGCQAFDSQGEPTATPPRTIRLHRNERLTRKLKNSHAFSLAELRTTPRAARYKSCSSV